MVIWKNMIFLFFLALLPIFTKWVLVNPTELIPVFAYDILFIFINLSYFIIFREIYRKKDQISRNGRNDIKHSLLSHISFLITLLVVILLVIILSLFFPKIAVILFMGLPILSVLLNIFFEERNPNHESYNLK